MNRIYIKSNLEIPKEFCHSKKEKPKEEPKKNELKEGTLDDDIESLFSH